MRQLIVIALVGTVWAPATRAQPITIPEQLPCKVRVIEAPPVVRKEVERWVAAEPRCVHQLDVRVEATAAGLHLIAVDSAGRIRERVIPDPQSAAVLVVSWMADDSTDDSTDGSRTSSSISLDTPPPISAPVPVNNVPRPQRRLVPARDTRA